MIPQGTPVATISASWHARASSRVGEREACRIAERKADRDLEGGARREPAAERNRRGDRRLDARRLAAPFRERAHDPGGVPSPRRLDGRGIGASVGSDVDLAGPIERAKDDTSVLARLGPDEQSKSTASGRTNPSL